LLQLNCYQKLPALTPCWIQKYGVLSSQMHVFTGHDILRYLWLKELGWLIVASLIHNKTLPYLTYCYYDYFTMHGFNKCCDDHVVCILPFQFLKCSIPGGRFYFILEILPTEEVKFVIPRVLLHKNNNLLRVNNEIYHVK